MFQRGLTADAFCLQILQKQIELLGADAFAHRGIVVLYSGPTERIQCQTLGMQTNPPRSAHQAERLGAIRIDDTAIGLFLTSSKLKTYFSEVYECEEDIRSAIQNVWAYASRQFIHSGFRTVSTAVCGADKTRVFYQHELPIILTEDTTIKTINDVSLQHFKDIYKKHSNPKDGFYAAYTEICKTEIELAHRRALTAVASEADEAWEDYTARKCFFDLEQESTAKKIAYAKLVTVLTSVKAQKTACRGVNLPHSSLQFLAAF